MAELDRQVGDSADDCRAIWKGSDWVFDATASQISTGYWAAVNFKHGGGMRFTNITIPKGSTITSAYLTLTSYTDRSSTVVRSKIRGEDADNPSAFSDYSDYSGRPRTSAEVNWDSIPAWTAETEYNSPEIKTVIQEIIDRANWASGNAVVIFWDDHDDRSDHNSETVRAAYAYDSSSTKAPKLHIEYTPPAPGGPRSCGYIIG